jgi:hypothetical protein
MWLHRVAEAVGLPVKISSSAARDTISAIDRLIDLVDSPLAQSRGWLPAMFPQQRVICRHYVDKLAEQELALAAVAGHTSQFGQLRTQGGDLELERCETFLCVDHITS